MTLLLDVLKRSEAFLAARGIESARLDAQVLLAHGLGIRKIDLYLQHDRPLSEPELERLRGLVRERARGVPVAYLTGEREFFSLPFRVTRDTLVPRPETEGLVEAGLLALSGAAAPRVADVGTGSGCVIVALLHRLPSATGTATDVSKAALLVARENALRHGVLSRVELLEGSLLDPLRSTPAWGALDAVLSNPPYVVRGDPALDSRVAEHEPAAALYVEGDDPLAPAREIAAAALSALAPGGFLAIEVGAGSGGAAQEMLVGLGFAGVRVAADGAGIPRVVSGRSPAARS